MSQARIGIIGAGFWATSVYLPFFKSHPEVHCVGVVRGETAGLAELQRAFNLEVATTDAAELLSLGCDGVVVSSPHALHRLHAEQALETGAHVLIEKPMTLKLEDARALAAAAEKAGRCLTVAHGWNYSRMATWAMDLVAEGAIGQISSVTGFMASALTELFSGKSGLISTTVQGFTIAPSPDTWARADAGGGYLYGQLSHQLGLALALVKSQPEQVFARMQFLENGCDIDTTVSVSFEDGVIGSFSGTGRLPWGVRYPLEIRLIGHEGVLTLDFERDEANVYLKRATDVHDFALSSGEHAFRGRPPDECLDARQGEGIYTCDGPAQLLIDVCLGREVTDRAPAELGVRTVAIMEAAYHSARRQEPIAIRRAQR